MEYILRFDDGSSAYLAHYGVKGMKWHKHLFGDKDDPNAQREDFDARDYGFEDNSTWSRKAARAENFGTLAEKGKMSREAALKKAKEDYHRYRNMEGFATKRADGTPMTKMEREKVLKDQYKKQVAMANTFKSKKQLNAELKRKNEYLQESRLNKAEFAGDEKGLREAQRRTDAMYGRKGKEAQRVEAQRRRRASDELESTLKKDGMVRGSDGVWRKGDKKPKKSLSEQLASANIPNSLKRKAPGSNASPYAKAAYAWSKRRGHERYLRAMGKKV